MAINLLGLTPNKVSRDLSGYITYIYGPGGAGKTTFYNHVIKGNILFKDAAFINFNYCYV